MAIEYNFTLDMDRSKRDNNIAYARTGDVDSITINADLVLNGSPYTPTGTNAFFECITPNGHSIRAAAEKSGSTVSVEVPSAAFQAAGVINVAYFRFESGDADNPTYVESTEPFAIVVREGIGDNIDAGDYIEEWRQLADKLDEIVAGVEQKAEQAETAINEQKTEVDQLKAQVQTSMAQDAEDVSDAKDTAISNINSSQGAVDAAIDQLEQKTQEAVDAAQAALDGTLAADIEAEVGRTLKLDIADMVNISDNTSLSSLTDVGSYCCKTASAAATIIDSPVNDSPFNLYVFSSATSGQAMQLVVPIDLQGRPTAEWHVRFGTSSAMDTWSVIGGGADIAAGLGIDVTGDAQKTVSLDTTAFYQHHEAAGVIQGSTEVTGGGRVKELKVYGNTRQNLWQNPSGTSNGLTVTANVNGSITVGGTTTHSVQVQKISYVLKPGTQYTVSVDSVPQNVFVLIQSYDADDTFIKNEVSASGGWKTQTFTLSANAAYVKFGISAFAGVTVSGTYRIMLNEGSTAQPWCKPGLNGVDELSVVCAGKNLLDYNDILSSANVVSDDGVLTGADPSSDRRVFSYATSDFHLNLTPGTYRLLVDVSKATNVTLSELRVIKQNDATAVSSSVVFRSTGIKEFEFYVTDLPVAIMVKLYDAEARLAIYRDGDETEEWEPYQGSTTSIDLDGHTLNSLPDGTRDELTVNEAGEVTLTQRVGVVDYVASDFRSPSPEYCERDLVLSYASGITFKSDDQLSDFATIGNADIAPGYPLVSVYSQGSATKLRGGTGENEDTLVAQLTAFKSMLGSATWHHLYKLATPQTIKLPSVTLPELASPDYTVFASSNVPAEIEAEVVKVDYLPAPDVYTKEEVDQKIEDIDVMPDIVPVSQGGTGVTTAAAERNRLGLGNTTNAVPVANGGTGATTNDAALYNLLNGVKEEESVATDGSFFAFFYEPISASNGSFFKRTGANVWAWIASKIRSTFGFSSANVLPLANGGTGGTSAASARSNLSVYSKSEVDGKVPKVVYGTGNIPSNAENGTIYIQYRS